MPKYRVEFVQTIKTVVVLKSHIKREWDFAEEIEDFPHLLYEEEPEESTIEEVEVKTVDKLDE